ncbi:MAG: hypothetical protein HPY57_12650 [Ignavibacteria bacterium]|nr:hypothetical protein [Ignavibacteria bacterium]
MNIKILKENKEDLYVKTIFFKTDDIIRGLVDKSLFKDADSDEYINNFINNNEFTTTLKNIISDLFMDEFDKTISNINRDTKSIQFLKLITTLNAFKKIMYLCIKNVVDYDFNIIINLEEYLIKQNSDEDITLYDEEFKELESRYNTLFPIPILGGNLWLSLLDDISHYIRHKNLIFNSLIKSDKLVIQELKKVLDSKLGKEALVFASEDEKVLIYKIDTLTIVDVDSNSIDLNKFNDFKDLNSIKEGNFIRIKDIYILVYTDIFSNLYYDIKARETNKFSSVEIVFFKNNKGIELFTGLESHTYIHPHMSNCVYKVFNNLSGFCLNKYNYIKNLNIFINNIDELKRRMHTILNFLHVESYSGGQYIKTENQINEYKNSIKKKIEENLNQILNDGNFSSIQDIYSNNETLIIDYLLNNISEIDENLLNILNDKYNLILKSIANYTNELISISTYIDINKNVNELKSNLNLLYYFLIYILYKHKLIPLNLKWIPNKDDNPDNLTYFNETVLINNVYDAHNDKYIDLEQLINTANAIIEEESNKMGQDFINTVKNEVLNEIITPVITSMNTFIYNLIWRYIINNSIKSIDNEIEVDFDSYKSKFWAKPVNWSKAIDVLNSIMDESYITSLSDFLSYNDYICNKSNAENVSLFLLESLHSYAYKNRYFISLKKQNISNKEFIKFNPKEQLLKAILQEKLLNIKI